jgi:2-oxoglutarate ferredoxin oxidoreductase subunit alpha
MTKDPEEIDALNQHLSAKIENHLDEICFTEFDGQDGAEILLISYGITSTSANTAVKEARKAGLKVSLLIIHTLWPVPELEIKSASKGIKRIIFPELNQGQYMREIQRVLSNNIQFKGIHRVDGGLISPEHILVEGNLR